MVVHPTRSQPPASRSPPPNSAMQQQQQQQQQQQHCRIQAHLQSPFENMGCHKPLCRLDHLTAGFCSRKSSPPSSPLHVVERIPPDNYTGKQTGLRTVSWAITEAGRQGSRLGHG